ncbi:patatin-like phospholipase family protein [Variovorax sp. PAMC26660]|uniref:patatin-like phospholipase family protein n=1 Tax=Variovorax sp. PAMC26660 TaxID=2762322 RepID=UPI00164D4452|nr:patatin-like phospholipase family protein [Variovorax sp. PAMC26660]QNK69012.1 patatin-like phospholipase family protein [Variovorax sp. PAMC26660]
MPETSPVTGLLLTGGGARAAYQVGVLEAIAEIRRAAGPAAGTGNPFPVITGTSAGAINAAALACGADNFDHVVAHIAEVWSQFRAEQVYRADSLSVIGSGARWRMLLGFGRFAANWMRVKPKSLLDNAPLADLLQRMVPLDRLPQLMQQGHVQALAVTASSYSSGEHVTFFEAAVPMEPWVRSQRLSVRDRITHAHLLASSAIPFVFPATALPMQGHTEYFGDGSMRQSAPIAAAIHLGAQRILVIGAGRMHEPRETPAPNTHSGYPTMAQIAGHALSSIFLDALAVDIERLHRINHTLGLIPAEAREASGLRPLDLLVISPSERLDVIAARHVDALPGAVRHLLGGSKVAADVKGGALASYLLFESGYTRELMALGRSDAMKQRDEVLQFFGWNAV